jgi:hypothetical protein
MTAEEPVEEAAEEELAEEEQAPPADMQFIEVQGRRSSWPTTR